MWTIDGLENESDVEQKFIYQFLIEPRPLGLGIPHSAIQTKANIRRFAIGKGSDQKLYYPDYLIVTMGFPVVILEAKHPDESVEEGYRQARLYAHELNALYTHGFSPANFVIATNGIEFWYGYVDQQEPLGKAECKSLGPYSPHIAKLIDLLSWERITDVATALAQHSRPADLFKPRRLLGGKGYQNEEVAQNSFGATVTTAISSIFNPTSVEDRAFIAKNAYIPSTRRERYIDPIDRVIRAARPPCETQAQELDDSSHPTKLIDKLKNTKQLEHKVLLLIGSVGSGKSTFIDHLYEVALPRDLVDSTVWCRINMNNAPVTPHEIYTWLRREIIFECRRSLPKENFDALAVIRRLYGVEINLFNKGVGELYQSQPEIYNIKLAEHIEKIQSDQKVVTNAHVRFTCGERNKILIIVLDNCDKKNRDEQLLMFETAQWLQNEFRCLVMLPLRDETYDNHRDQPPLDTALKDFVFRIEPPLFQQVLIKRVQLALKDLGGKQSEKLRFTLPNGITVEYPRAEQAFYLTSIVKSLFEHDRFVRRMIVGLSGRNIRRALEIFLEFCNSGHISEKEIFKIRQSEGNYSLPFHRVATVLLRMNRRFYDSDHSYIKNIFGASNDDPLPVFFCRYMILRWLKERFSTSGTCGLRGYFPKLEIKLVLIPFGLSPDIIDREVNYLLAAQCIIAEHLRLDSVEDDDLIRLGPAGFAHLELVGNISYLAAVSEDTFFSDRLQAERVLSRIKHADSHLNIKTAVDNAEELVTYLEHVRSSLIPPNGFYMQDNLLDKLSQFSEARDALTRIAKHNATEPWFDADKRLPRGSTHRVTITNAIDIGYFVEFNDGLVALIHKSNMGDLTACPGDLVEVTIQWVDVIRKRMGLKLMSIIQEDAGDQVSGTSNSMT